jgi:TRAP-type C4-dicarboxylate transport system permease small subunit
MAADRRRESKGPRRDSAEDAAQRAEQAAAQAERERYEALALAEAARDAALEAAKRAGRFSREFVATVISVVGTALGVVVALAWNAALTGWFQRFSKGSQLPALFTYALLVTLLAVVVVFLLGRLARRLNAEAVEFKIEAKREEQRKSS